MHEEGVLALSGTFSTELSSHKVNARESRKAGKWRYKNRWTGKGCEKLQSMLTELQSMLTESCFRGDSAPPLWTFTKRSCTTRSSAFLDKLPNEQTGFVFSYWTIFGGISQSHKHRIIKQRKGPGQLNDTGHSMQLGLFVYKNNQGHTNTGGKKSKV